MELNGLLAYEDHGSIVYNPNVFTLTENYQPYAPSIAPQLTELYRVEDGSGDASLPFNSNPSQVENMAMANVVINEAVVDYSDGYHHHHQLDQMETLNDVKADGHNFVIHPETVFVTGMSLSVSKHDIELLFSRVGKIKVDDLSGKPKIFAYKNKYTGQSRGEATVTFDDASAAQAAISWMNNSIFCGKKIKVSQAYISKEGNNVRYDYKRERQPTQRRNRKKIWRPAADNWACGACRNSNFVWRTSCNRCKGNRSEVEVVLSQIESEQRNWRPLRADWQCGFCLNQNFWHRSRCNRCGSPKEDIDIGERNLKSSEEEVVMINGNQLLD